jgi:hypothetical protein
MDSMANTPHIPLEVLLSHKPEIMWGTVDSCCGCEWIVDVTSPYSEWAQYIQHLVKAAGYDVTELWAERKVAEQLEPAEPRILLAESNPTSEQWFDAQLTDDDKQFLAGIETAFRKGVTAA